MTLFQLLVEVTLHPQRKQRNPLIMQLALSELRACREILERTA